MANRINIGDEIRVIASSRSLSIVYQDIYDNALQFLSESGFKVTFSDNCRERDSFNSSSIQSRIDDLHNAFQDPNVKAIFTAIGGFNVNQLLEHVDYKLIKEHPKILCGYSDITALLNAVYAQTGLITYHGPHFSSFGFGAYLDYTYGYFKKCLFESKAFSISPSLQAQNYYVIQPGICKGTIIGGNLCTLNLLQGTRFMPVVDDVVLFIEDDNISGDYFVFEFDRNLESLVQAIGVNRIKGIVFGRFDESCKLTVEAVKQIVKIKKQLSNIPVLFNVDFGHVQPFVTFPIGGQVLIDASKQIPSIKITEH